MAKGQMIVALDFSGIAEDEFHDWFDTEHKPERERVAGFLSCQALDRCAEPEGSGPPLRSR